MNTLVTGVSGAGKTTIATELTQLGYDARNMDSIEGLCSWVNLSTGQAVDPELYRESDDDWLEKYDWLWDEARLTKLVGETTDTFYCGSSGNQDKFYHLFGKIFLLKMDEQLIRERILNNERDHNYGRRPGELEAILGYFEDEQDKAINFGAIVIDARKPLAEVISMILSEAGVQLHQ